MLAASLLVVGAPAAAEDLVALTQAVASQCKSGGDASQALGKLLSAVEAEYGGDHDAAELVRRYAGTSDTPAPSKDPSRATDPALSRALKKLRSCTHASSRQVDQVVETVGFAEHFDVALKLYERALFSQALEAVELAAESGDGGDTAGMMKLHDLTAKIQLQLGKRDVAIREAEAAEKLAEKTGAVGYRIDYARLYAQAGDLEKAQAQLQRIEGAVKEPGDRAEYAEVRGYLALLLGSPRLALVDLDEALAGHQKTYGTEHPSTAAVLQLQGDAYRQAGDFPAAIAAYRETLRIRRKNLGPNHALTARTQNAIGVLQGDLRDWDNADGAFEAALTSLRETQGEESVDTITVRTNQALARWGFRKNRTAADQYAAAVADLRAALGADHPTVAATVRNQARMEFDLGNPGAAQKLLEDALAAQKRSLGAVHPDLAPTRLQLGELLTRQGKVAEGAAEIDMAIEVLVAALGPEHPIVARARTKRARIAVAQGDSKTALRSAVDAARSIQVFSQRTFGAISDRQRALLSQDSQEVIGALLSVPDVDAKDLFVTLLPHRDSVLRSIAARRASEQTGGRFASELDELRKRYVAAVLGQGPDTAERVRSLSQAIEGLEVLQGGEGANVSLRSPAEVLKAACAHIPEDAVLIKFAAFDRTPKGRATETVPAYSAFAVDSSCQVTRVDLGDGAAIQKSAEEFASAMRDQLMDQPIARLELAKTILEPLMPALADKSRWLVVPDGSLWGIPIGVLPDPANPNAYLLERVTIGYLTSTYELADAEPGRTDAGVLERSLLVGAPDFGGSQAGGPLVLTDTGPCQLLPFEMLPATAEELKDIGKLLTTPRVLTGADVTKRRIEQELKNKPKLLHFATHAYFAGNAGCGSQQEDGDNLRERPIAPNPLLLSGIVLAGANRPTRVEEEGSSGILTAYEVAGLDMRSAGLVVLSACDTGTGLALRGQEVQGLRWGFRAAGARALVTSLWRSNDAATRRMMRSFYESLVSEELKSDPLRGAEALRIAKLAQLKNEARLGIRRPLIWANFIFSGVL